MNLPLVTANIGKAWADDDIFSVLYQEPKFKQEEDKRYYVVFMTFDLDKKEIYFEDLQPYNNGAIKRYKYFGNNKAASKQFHVVREGKDTYYLVNLWKNLRDILNDYELNGLASELLELYQAGLISEETGELDFNRMTYVLKNQGLELEYDREKKKISHKVQDKIEEITMEGLIKKSIGAAGGDQIALLVPRIKKNDKSFEISNHADYLELIKRFHKLGEENTEKTKNTNKKKVNPPAVCYICGCKKDNLSCVDYSTRLRRDGINKVFTTTTINYAQNIELAGYEHNYSFCKECFDDLRQGEKVVLARMSTRLAGERTFIIPEGITSDFEYEDIDEIKREIDFVFKPRQAEDWIRGIESETRRLHIEYFNLNFIIYDTDGNSVTVLQTISDVNNGFFVETIEAFKKHLMNVTDHLKYFSLGSIYRVIPVRTKKDGKQVDSGRVLSLYKSILKREKVDVNLIFRYALEALDKGLKQLAANRINNCFNLNLRRFSAGGEDFYIKRIIFSYLVIMHALQELDILTRPPFKIYREGEFRIMDEKLRQDECPDTIWEAECFLEEQHFTSEARALFYLGLIMKRVSIAQASKGHKNKPILKKVNFQGMNRKDILRFYDDLVEKLRQYNKITFYTEWLMNRFHYYMGSILTQGDWKLSEHASVFFIMAGYAFQVGKKYSPDLSTEEQQTMDEETTNITEEEDDNDDTGE